MEGPAEDGGVPMDQRKRLILQAITDDYIASAEPVGSRTIARKYRLGVSPATIRNEMADLEEAGYLEQPHTSAGRIPSDKGYRFYVDALMDPATPSEAERLRLREEVKMRERAFEEIIHRTARLLSLLTQYTSVVVTPNVSDSECRHLQLIALDENHLLVVLVTEPGFVQNRIIEMSEPISHDEVARLNNVLNEQLRGVSLGDITSTLIASLREEIDESALFQTVLELLTTGLERNSDSRIYLEGTMNIFEHPEFHDVERAKVLLRLLEEREAVFSILSDSIGRGDMTVTIGRENRREEMHECSMVTATYRMGNQVIGSLGLLGPTRMNYARVVGIVHFMAESLSEAITDHMRR